MKARWIQFVKERWTAGGRLVLSGLARLGRAVRRAAGVHRSRSYVQRAWFSLAVAGIAVWIVLGLDLAPTLFAPFREAPQDALREEAIEHGGEAGSPAAGPGAVGERGSADPAPQSPVEVPPVRRPAPAPPPEEKTEPSPGREAQVNIPRIPSLPAASIDSMVWPAAGEIARPFGWYRHPIFNDWRYSAGVTIRPAAGEQTVRAALAGRVKDVVNEGGVWRVSIEHQGGWLTEYEGLARVYVDSLAVVETGEPIGLAQEATPAGGGLLFAVRRGTEAVDPSSLMGDPVPVVAQGEFEAVEPAP